MRTPLRKGPSERRGMRSGGVRLSGIGRPRTVRQALLVMLLGIIAPAVVAMGVLAAVLLADTQRTYANQLIATTRALALALDRHILQGEATLQTLAASPALSSGDLQALRLQSSAAVADKAEVWISLKDARGQVFNSRRPELDLQSRIAARPWPAELPAEPRLSDLFVGPFSGQPIIAIDRAVEVGGEPMILSYMQSPQNLQALFADQPLKDSWTGSIVDRNLVLVARSRRADEFRRQGPTPDLRRALEQAPEGVVLTRTLEGTPTLSAYSRSPTTGWTFVVGVPRSEVFATALNGIAGLTLVALALIVGGAVLAWRTSSALAADTRVLARAAAAVSRHEVAPEAALRFSETEEVHKILRAASRDLIAHDAAVQRHDREQALLINELNHRVKNSLATVQSLARHTFHGSTEQKVEDFIERLLALSRGHDLLTRRVWEASPIQIVVEGALEPHMDRIGVAGPDATLPPNAALALTLILNELATNATKYGALSVPQGVVRVDWRGTDGGLAVSWRESGGPRPATPDRKGFGSRLIEQTARSALEGRAELRFVETGLTCEIEIGAAALTEPPGTAAAPE